MDNSKIEPKRGTPLFYTSNREGSVKTYPLGWTQEQADSLRRWHEKRDLRLLVADPVTRNDPVTWDDSDPDEE